MRLEVVEARMETLCSTCLSRNRNITSVKNILNGDNSWEYLDMSIQKYVCWECKAMFKKISKFKKQVVTAQHVLRNNFVSKFDLSNLKTENQTNVISIKEKCFEIELLHTFDDIPEDPFNIKEENDMLCLEPMNRINNEIENGDLIPVMKHKEVENQVTANEIKDFEEAKENIIKDIEMKGISNLDGKILSKVIVGQTLKIISNIFDDTGRSKEVELYLTPHEQRLEKFNLRLLTDMEMLNLREERKSRTLYKAAKLKCDMCILQYNTEDKFKQHLSNNHVKKKGCFLCNICKCYINDKATYQDHFARHYVVYQCKECGYEEQNQIAFTRHYRSEHDQIGYKCQRCQQEFRTDTKMRQHVERHHTVLPPCELCGKTFVSQNGRLKHMRQHKGVVKLKCQTCGKEYKGIEGLRAHQRVHNRALADENAYCAECDKQFNNIYQYNRHLKVNVKHRPPGSLKYKCTECPKAFLIRSACNMHMASVHHNKRDFVCSICNKDFIRRSRLEEHIKHTHEGVPKPRKYPCTYCEKIFTCRNILENHVRIHTGEKPFECNVCHRRFNQRASLRTHKVGVHKMSKADAVMNVIVAKGEN